VQFTNEIRRLVIGFLLIFVLIALFAAYLSVRGPGTILLRDDNPRLFEKRASIVRGTIYDRNENVLVTSLQADSGIVSRQYHHPSMNSVLGYYSLRYGEGGAEAAYNSILNGDDRQHDFEAFFSENLLHRPRYGSDIRLTFDLDIQTHARQLMSDHRGAIVVMSVPDGQVLSLVSTPTYDPNLLDEKWIDFVAAEGDPFFNRVLQGKYQPGSSAYTLLIISALLNNIPLDTTFDNATDTVNIADVSLQCVTQAPSDTLTLADAYLYGCPAPFAQLAEQIGLDRLEPSFDLFNTAVILPGFVPEPAAEDTELIPFELKDALGQGTIAINPLQLSALTAAFINSGNAPQPYALLETRLPGTDQWLPVDEIHPSTPLLTAETADQVANLMRQIDHNTDLDIGGQSALAYSGDETHVWFTGFIKTSANDGIVVVVVIEDSTDTDLAAQIGTSILQMSVNQ
jgi:penicillin-binding protein A